jgi:hypothetical protein
MCVCACTYARVVGDVQVYATLHVYNARVASVDIIWWRALVGTCSHVSWWRISCRERKSRLTLEKGDFLSSR